ncbi:MAG: VOC family protein [Thermomicrobiales bacterium]
MKVESIALGAPIWADLWTSDFDRAATFYNAIFGWEVPPGSADFGGYSTATLNGANIAGVMPKAGDPEAAGMPDAWTLYLHTADTGATAEAITANGGTVVTAPMEVGPFGTMAVGMDPAGSCFGIWQPNTHKGFGVLAEAGAPCWFENLTLDVDKASAFYPATFGLGLQVVPMGESAYNLLTSGDGENNMVAGITAVSSLDAAGMPSAWLAAPGTPVHWLVYFGVNDTDATIAQVESLGGRVIVGPDDNPFGRWAFLADPMGAIFAIISVQNSAEG